MLRVARLRVIVTVDTCPVVEHLVPQEPIRSDVIHTVHGSRPIAGIAWFLT